VASAIKLSYNSVNEEGGKSFGAVVITVMGILTFTAPKIFILIGESCRCCKSSRKMLNCFCVYVYLNESKSKILRYLHNYGTVVAFAWKWLVKLCEVSV
jgi:hypothetical protein